MFGWRKGEGAVVDCEIRHTRRDFASILVIYCDLMLRRVSPLVRLTRERGLLPATKEAFVPSLAVLFMLVPQSLAYAVLAGVPPIYGLYSSTVPLLVYSLFGTSGQVAIGPVAMMSLLTAGAVENLGVRREQVVRERALRALRSGVPVA